MAFILASFLKTHLRTPKGKRKPVALDNENGILDNILSHIPHTDRLVVVANDPADHADNDQKLRVVRKSFELTGIRFSQAVALDDRNGNSAKDVISGASLIILSGGKCLRQMEFFERIGLRELLSDNAALTIGISAGAMNLCSTVANFPEEAADLAEPRFYYGMGLYGDGAVVPHFDGELCEYQLGGDDFDVAREYILPMSHTRELIGIPNNSYILIENNGAKSYFGAVYKILAGEVKRLF